MVNIGSSNDCRLSELMMASWLFGLQKNDTEIPRNQRKFEEDMVKAEVSIFLADGVAMLHIRASEGKMISRCGRECHLFHWHNFQIFLVPIYIYIYIYIYESYASHGYMEYSWYKHIKSKLKYFWNVVHGSNNP